jgi:hypothetical protein
MLNRRTFLAASTAAAATTQPPVPKGKADACIFMWLGGGAAHMDTWDPKVMGDGKKKRGPTTSRFPRRSRASRFVSTSGRSAPLLDRAAIRAFGDA